MFLSICLYFFYFLDTGGRFTAFSQARVFFDDSNSLFVEKNGKKGFDSGKELLDQLSIDLDNVEFGSDEKIDILSALKYKDYDVYLSDFQGVSATDLTALKKDSLSSKTLFHLGNITAHQNLFIDSLSIEFSSEDLSTQRISLIPRLSGTSEPGVGIFRLINEQRQLSSVAVDFSKMSKVIFDISSGLSGEFSVELQGDDVYYDNKFIFYLENRIKPTVAIVSESSSLYLREVFGNLDAFTVSNINPESIDYRLVELSDIVILNELSDLPSGFVSQLDSKTILVFPGKDGVEFTKWKGVSALPRESGNPLSFAIDFNHPLFSGVFASKSKDVDAPFGTPVFDIKGEYEVLISFRDKTPYLLRLLNSNTYFFNSSLDPKLSNFASHALFLPLMYQLAFSSVEYSYNASSYPGDIRSMQVENQEYPPRISSDNFELIPEFNPSEKGLAIKIPQLEPGFYDLKHIEDSSVIAVNILKEESLMEGITQEELKTFFEETSHINIADGDFSKEGLGLSESSLWKYALILILIFVVSETLLHRFLR